MELEGRAGKGREGQTFIAVWLFLSEIHRPFILGILDVGLPHVIPRNKRTSSTEEISFRIDLRFPNTVLPSVIPHHHSTLQRCDQLLCSYHCSISRGTPNNSLAYKRTKCMHITPVHHHYYSPLAKRSRRGYLILTCVTGIETIEGIAPRGEGLSHLADTESWREEVMVGREKIRIP